jgi:transcriptional repressor NrdR
MRCPFCQHNKDKVIDSREIDEGKAIRRRRHCLHCARRFTTYEHIEEKAHLTVIKTDGTRVPFSREKVATGLERACYKRPISAEQIEQIVVSVEEELFQRAEREVASIEIGRAVAERLKQIDQVAYVRFASVYKQFKDINDLLDEVREVVETAGRREPPGQGRLF